MLQWDEPLISPIGSSLQDCGPSITKSKLHSLKIKFETRMLSFLWHYYHMKHCIKLNCLLLRSFEKNWSINISIFVSVYPFCINNLLLVMYQIEVWKTTFHFSNLYPPPPKNCLHEQLITLQCLRGHYIIDKQMITRNKEIDGSLIFFFYVLNKSERLHFIKCSTDLF